LRERSGDVAEIAEAVLRRMGWRMKTDPARLDTEALRLLEDYPFPGNVRELENVLERALTLCTNGLITSEHIKLRSLPRPQPDPEQAAAASTSLPSSAPVGTEGGALGVQLQDIERDAIIKALEKTRYNKTAAAKLLGMSFRALRYRVKKLGIE
jgi:two-component system, NtrC family, response regulator PilR